MTGSYLGAESVLCDDWIVQQLATVATDLNALYAGLASRIYVDVAPDDVAWPVIVFQCQTPPRDIRGVGVSRVMVDTLYVVKAIAQSDTYAPLRDVARVIDAAMTQAAPSAINDGLVLSSIRQNEFRLATQEKGSQYRHLGGEFQMYAQAAS